MVSREGLDFRLGRKRLKLCPFMLVLNYALVVLRYEDRLSRQWPFSMHVMASKNYASSGFKKHGASPRSDIIAI